MPARLNNRHQAMVRDKIQSSQLINRLQNHADGKVELTATQVQSIRILLDKALPNLQATEIDATIQDDRVESLSDQALMLIAGGKAG